MENYFDSIPIELNSLIFSFLHKRIQEILKFVCRKWHMLNPSKISTKITQYFARNGYQNLLEWAKANNYFNKINLSDNAILSNNLNVVKWTWDNGCQFGDKACGNAGSVGNLNIIKFIGEKGCVYNKKMLYNAALKGHVEIVNWYVNANFYYKHKKLCAKVVKAGHMDLLKQFNGKQMAPMIMLSAILQENIEIVKWIDEFIEFKRKIFSVYALIQGNSAIINYLRSQSYKLMDGADELLLQDGFVDIEKLIRIYDNGDYNYYIVQCFFGELPRNYKIFEAFNRLFYNNLSSTGRV